MPLALQGLHRRGRDGEHIDVGLHGDQCLTDTSERPAVAHHAGDGFVDPLSPTDGSIDLLGRVGFSERRDAYIGQRVLGVEEALQFGARGDFETPLSHLGAVAQEVEHLLQRDPTVQAACGGSQVDEDGRLAGQSRDRLKVPVLDGVRREALLVLDVHRIESAPVRVHAHEELVLRFEIDEHLGCSGNV